MQNKEFNLLDEPWIKVIAASLEQREVSLTDVMVHAREYLDLSGEMATQDVAVLRLLLAVAGTVFYRYDADGEEAELSEENDMELADVLERWKGYWERKSFPEQAVRIYLEGCRERFWLFHPETPFWQVSGLEYGTEFGVKCLFGNMKESMNKATRHHFSMTDGDAMGHLGYGEAVRWLLHLNAYGVNVKTDKRAPGEGNSVGVGRLGQLGFVMVNGGNLFETLMLNLCPVREGGTLWELPNPVWEQEVCREQGMRIAPPDNLPELYTLQSRRIMLRREKDGSLAGFRAIGGEFYPVEDDFNEPMTVWKEKKGADKGEQVQFQPRLHDPAVHAWREFSTLLKKEQGENKHTPGVVLWMNLLYKEKVLVPGSLVTFRMIGMVYGDRMKYNYGDCVNDRLTLSAGLLDDLGREWVRLIGEQVEKCQEVASRALYHFSDNISRILYGNGSEKGAIKEELVGRYFFSIDGAFREWLVGIRPEQDSIEEKIEQWERQSRIRAKEVVREYINDLGTYIYLRRKNAEQFSVPQIMDRYLGELGKIYRRRENGQKNAD